MYYYRAAVCPSPLHPDYASEPDPVDEIVVSAGSEATAEELAATSMPAAHELGMQLTVTRIPHVFDDRDLEVIGRLGETWKNREP